VPSTKFRSLTKVWPSTKSLSRTKWHNLCGGEFDTNKKCISLLTWQSCFRNLGCGLVDTCVCIQNNIHTKLLLLKVWSMALQDLPQGSLPEMPNSVSPELESAFWPHFWMMWMCTKRLLTQHYL
jgi:hypothetical protein